MIEASAQASSTPSAAPVRAVSPLRQGASNLVQRLSDLFSNTNHEYYERWEHAYGTPPTLPDDPSSDDSVEKEVENILNHPNFKELSVDQMLKVIGIAETALYAGTFPRASIPAIFSAVSQITAFVEIPLERLKKAGTSFNIRNLVAKHQAQTIQKERIEKALIQAASENIHSFSSLLANTSLPASSLGKVLIAAAHNFNLAAVEILIEHREFPNIPIRDVECAMIPLCKKETKGTFQHLIERRSPFEFSEKGVFTCLEKAITEDVEMIKIIKLYPLYLQRISPSQLAIVFIKTAEILKCHQEKADTKEIFNELITLSMIGGISSEFTKKILIAFAECGNNDNAYDFFVALLNEPKIQVSESDLGEVLRTITGTRLENRHQTRFTLALLNHARSNDMLSKDLVIAAKNTRSKEEVRAIKAHRHYPTCGSCVLL